MQIKPNTIPSPPPWSVIACIAFRYVFVTCNYHTPKILYQGGAQLTNHALCFKRIGSSYGKHFHFHTHTATKASKSDPPFRHWELDTPRQCNILSWADRTGKLYRSANYTRASIDGARRVRAPHVDFGHHADVRCVGLVHAEPTLKTAFNSTMIPSAKHMPGTPQPR